MAQIGSTLREARIRRKIDIGAVESATKIRAKYLRALEAEEFDTLPGPAYVKSFIRTYAIYLGLDANLLVDQYRSQHEKHEEYELSPLSRQPVGRERARPKRSIHPVLLVAAVLVVVLALLVVLDMTGPDDEIKGDGSARDTTTQATTDTKRKKTEPSNKRSGAQTTTAKKGGDVVKLTVTAKQNVWVCLESTKGKRLIASETLPPGESRGPFSEKSYKVTFGNGLVEMKANGKKLEVDDTSSPIGYRIDGKGATLLKEGERPTCT